MFSRLRNFLFAIGQPITLLFVPNTNLPLWRVHFSLPFVAFCLAIWVGVTVWAGYRVGHDIDYWITKADNQVMRVKMAYLATEISRSRQDLDRARDTDRQMRVLLGMQSKRAIIESDEGMGGPNVSDRLEIALHLSGNAAKINQSKIRKSLNALRRESEQRLASFQETSWYIGDDENVGRAIPVGWPAAGVLLSRYGFRMTFEGGPDAESGELHGGIDIANRAETPVTATADGVVRRAGWSGERGQIVVIEHDLGYSTLYGHASRLLVRDKEKVKRGQVIAYMGATGRSSAIHLHYEVRRFGLAVNPTRFLKAEWSQPPAAKDNQGE